MVKLTKKEKEQLHYDFKRGFDYNALIDLVDILEKREKNEELLNFVKFYLQTYYIHNVDNDKLSSAKYTQNWENYVAIRDFVLEVYGIGAIVK
jgi:hypothetical protein